MIVRPEDYNCPLPPGDCTQAFTDALDAIDATGNGGTYRYIGSMGNFTNSINKGNPHACDAIRYGRGEIYCTGTGCDFD